MRTLITPTVCSKWPPIRAEEQEGFREWMITIVKKCK